MTTETAKHTPGPWRFGDHAIDRDKIARRWLSKGYVGADINSMPSFYYEIGREDQRYPPAVACAATIADARLIAAAPELLEALEGVLLSETDTHRESDDRWSVFRYQAHAAIAKARGTG